MTSVCCRVPHGEPPVSIPIPDAIADKLRKWPRIDSSGDVAAIRENSMLAN